MGVVVLYVLNIISKRNEKAEIELKYNKKNINSLIHNNAVDGQEVSNEESSDSEENYLQKLLESYYNQALQQANIQFWFSIIAATVGFVFIYAVIFLEKGYTWSESLLKTFPAVAIEVVSSLFFKESKKTRERATNLFSELHFDNKVEKSVEIADTIEDTATKSDIKAKIALHIVGLDDSSKESGNGSGK